MDYLMYFPGICIVGQAGQRHAINSQLIKVVTGLQLYSVVWCRRLPYHITTGYYVLTKNGRQVVLEFPVPCDTVIVPL